VGRLRHGAIVTAALAATVGASAVTGCGDEGSTALPTTNPSFTSDSTLPGARGASDPVARIVAASAETDPVLHRGDVAQDVAIWIDPVDASRSTIIATDIGGGLAVYDLAGKTVQYLPDGKMHNVDIRAGFPLAGVGEALVTAGNRDNNTIAIYKVNPQTRMLENVAARPIQPTVVTYGSCMYHSATTGAFFYIVTTEEGTVEQWELFDAGGRVDGRKVRELSVAPGQALEGCVADDQLGRLYLGEKQSGIWRYGAEPSAVDLPVKIDATGSTGHLVADVEGLTIAYGAGEAGYLIASSQGNNSFAMYERGGINAFVGRFEVRGGAVDAAEDTDGIDVTTVGLGPAFPAGLFIAQDGQNDNGNQNFKLVPWQSITAPA
jgi:3-phytase